MRHPDPTDLYFQCPQTRVDAYSGFSSNGGSLKIRNASITCPACHLTHIYNDWNLYYLRRRWWGRVERRMLVSA